MWVTVETAVCRLTSPQSEIEQEWRAIFGRHFCTETRPQTSETAALHLQLVDQLPAWPTTAPLFTGTPGQDVISVYTDDDHWWLHFLDGALVRVPQNAMPNETAVLTGWVTAPAMQNRRLEDITFTGLAPVLRRKGIYLLHAFAVCANGRSLLLVGPSHSGKTTTGLWLLANGWKMLANDVVALTASEGGVTACPTPNLVGIRPPTLGLVPYWHAFVAKEASSRGYAEVSSDLFVNGRYPSAAPAATICFMARSQSPTSTLTPLSPAIALSKLMAESVDRWDTAVLPAHTAFLAQLVQQAACYQLTVGNHPDSLADVLPHLQSPISNPT
ncbi:MAG: hypothetical protein Kow0080_35490 [Candidatus Promineifilaceae bacterium]